MGKLLNALLQLQSIERQIAQVRSRLRSRQNAVSSQQRKVDQLRSDLAAIQDQILHRRKQADSLELDLKTKEQEVSKFRAALNTAKTNKEYAAILTQINTSKADNAKLEEGVLKAMQEVDTQRADQAKVQLQIDAEQKRCDELAAANAGEIDRLTRMMEDLKAKRDAAAAEVPADQRKVFERIAEKNDGDAMAAVEIQGKKPPFEFVCGGCYMSLNAEHANALRTRDEIRMCDNCGRILYLEPETAKS